MSDELLLDSIAQVTADSTGQPVGTHRPQFYGMPKATREAVDHLAVLEAEAKKRGIR